jgi:hypothetical protein
MAKKLNPALLQEELKKFKLLSEYSFYTGENNDKEKEDNLILGSGGNGLEEADEEPEATPDADNAPEINADTPPETNVDNSPETPENDDDNLFDVNDDSADTGANVDMNQGAEEMPETGNEDVEVDVTQLVKGSEEATRAASDANQKTSELLSKFDELEKRISKMDSLTNKIEKLEKEIIKRNPTPVERLEMRSLDSFPFNIKINDYWKDVDGYDTKGEKEPKEFVLTKDDIDSGFTDVSIKKSLDSPEDYDEEDVY